MYESEQKLTHLLNHFENNDKDLESIIRFNKTMWPFFCKDSKNEIPPYDSEHAYNKFMENLERLNSYSTYKARIAENYTKRNAAKAARKLAKSIKDPDLSESWDKESRKLVHQCRNKYESQIGLSVRKFKETQNIKKLIISYEISMRLYSMALEFGEEYGFSEEYCANVLSYAGKYARKIAFGIKNNSELPAEMKTEMKINWLENWCKNKNVASIEYEFIGETELALEERLSSANALSVLAKETQDLSYQWRANSKYQQILAYKERNPKCLSEKTDFIFSIAQEKIKQ